MNSLKANWLSIKKQLVSHSKQLIEAKNSENLGGVKKAEGKMESKI